MWSHSQRSTTDTYMACYKVLYWHQSYQAITLWPDHWLTSQGMWLCPAKYTISHRICLWFCHVLICCGSVIDCVKLIQFIHLQYIPRNMHTVFALLCFVVVIHWLSFPYPSGLLHWHCGNLTIAPVPAKQPWWIWINTSCEFIMNDCITTTKQSTTKPCAYFLGYTVYSPGLLHWHWDMIAPVPVK